MYAFFSGVGNLTFATRTWAWSSNASVTVVPHEIKRAGVAKRLRREVADSLDESGFDVNGQTYTRDGSKWDPVYWVSSSDMNEPKTITREEFILAEDMWIDIHLEEKLNQLDHSLYEENVDASCVYVSVLCPDTSTGEINVMRFWVNPN